MKATSISFNCSINHCEAATDNDIALSFFSVPTNKPFFLCLNEISRIVCMSVTRHPHRPNLHLADPKGSGNSSAKESMRRSARSISQGSPKPKVQAME